MDALHCKPRYTRFAEIVLTETVTLDNIITLPGARNELGLFSDTSYDAEIEDYILTAVKRIERILGYLIFPRRVYDFYSRFEKRMMLSQPVNSVMNPVVEYSDTDNANQTLADTKILDYSDEYPFLIFGNRPNQPLSIDVQNPVNISYDSSGVSVNHKAMGDIQQATKWLINMFYFQRGSPDKGEFDMRHIYRLLDSHRNTAYVPDVAC